VIGDRQIDRVDSVSGVIPVYSGAVTLPGVVKKLQQLRSTKETPDGRQFVGEVLIVSVKWRCGRQSPRGRTPHSTSDSGGRPLGRRLRRPSRGSALKDG
jgi:hypothetical protein